MEDAGCRHLACRLLMKRTWTCLDCVGCPMNCSRDVPLVGVRSFLKASQSAGKSFTQCSAHSAALPEIV